MTQMISFYVSTLVDYFAAFCTLIKSEGPTLSAILKSKSFYKLFVILGIPQSRNQ